MQESISVPALRVLGQIKLNIKGVKMRITLIIRESPIVGWWKQIVPIPVIFGKYFYPCVVRWVGQNWAINYYSEKEGTE